MNEPFLLSAFELPKKASKSKHASASPVHVSHDGGIKEGSATVAVNGDGVHVLDVRIKHRRSFLVTILIYTRSPSFTSQIHIRSDHPQPSLVPPSRAW